MPAFYRMNLAGTWRNNKKQMLCRGKFDKTYMKIAKYMLKYIYLQLNKIFFAKNEEKARISLALYLWEI